MKTALQKVIDRLEHLYDEHDGHTAYQQGVRDCIDICIDELNYERATIKYIADAQRELYEKKDNG